MPTISRTDWGKSQPKCWFCPSTYRPQTHEIARGPHRSKALKEPATWMRTCCRCHHTVLDGMPIVRQLAHKLLNDSKHYNRVAVNLLRLRQPGAITEVEVFWEAMDIIGWRKPEGGE